MTNSINGGGQMASAKKLKVTVLSGTIAANSLIRGTEYGYWNATGGSAANPYYSFFPGFEGQDTTSYHCHGTTQAFVTTQEWPRTLTLCPAAFQIHPHSAAQNWLQVGTQLHNLETWGTVILHEWGHLINNCTFSIL